MTTSKSTERPAQTPPRTALSAVEDDADSRPLLIVRSGDFRYALELDIVREIVMLPELTPYVGGPQFVVGLVCLQSKLVTVADLNACVGRQPQPYLLSDRLVVLEVNDSCWAIVVNEVHGVRKSEAGADRAPMRPGGAVGSGIVSQLIVDDDGLIGIIDPERVFFKANLEHVEEGLGDSGDFSIANEDDLPVFRSRSDELRRRSAKQTEDESKLLAVIELEDELFAFSVDAVEEFAAIGRIARVPCCPPYIVGNMNLRGGVLTVLDVRAALKLSDKQPIEDGTVVVVGQNEQRVGMLVSEVRDVCEIPESNWTPRLFEVDEDYRLGTASFGGAMMTILDLPKLMSLDRWQVERMI